MGSTRHGTVAAVAREGDLEAVHRGHGLLAGHDNAGGDHGDHMHGKGGIHLRIIQHTGLHRGFGALKDLLAGLEQQLHRALQLRFVVFQQLRCPQKDSGVHIVAAAVHAAVGGFEGNIGFLPYGQGVHVAAQEEAFSAAADGCLHAGDVPVHLTGNAQLF